MYTRCPSCRAEISFMPPANPESLPEGYKHRIRCPHCGVTIGVKINKIDVAATYPGGYPNANPAYQQPYAPYAQAPTYPASSGFAPVNTAPEAVSGFDTTETKAKPEKKSGISRNIFMLIFSLGFIMLSIMGYLIAKGTVTMMEGTETWAAGITSFSGIGQWEMLCTNFEAFKSIFSMQEGIMGIMLGIAAIMPMVLFTFAGISFIIAFFGLIFKKYNKTLNLIFSIIIGAAAITTFFLFYINPTTLAGFAGENFLSTFLPYMLLTQNTDYTIISFFMDIQAHSMWTPLYFAIAGAAWGLLQFIFSLIFMKSMKKKVN